jgi:L-aspartate oxidase
METKAALWQLAGLRRSAADLERLREDPHTLAKLIATAALLRNETRGVHCRVEHPQPDPALERMHTVIDADGAARFERWD